MTSHFLQLFKRGRYVTVRSLVAAEADKKMRVRKHEERERFSVAAIAFCLENDTSFRTHFLKVIAGLSAEEITSVTLEPEYWGDLVLEGPSHVLVLEFKLGALLQEHQSPEARIFSKTGYGAKILRRFSKEGKTMRYIIIGKEFQTCRPNGLRCSAVPWRYLLLSHDRKESKIEKDLYDCLGYLGAAVFLNRHMKKPKLALDAHNAMSVCGTLQQLLAAEGLPLHGSIINPEYCGVEIKSGGTTPGSLHEKLKKLVQPRGQKLGWIGYEIVEFQPYLSIWFYSTTKTASAVRRRLKAANGIGSLGEYNNNDVYLRLLGSKSTNDAEWFRKILRIAGGSRAASLPS